MKFVSGEGPLRRLLLAVLACAVIHPFGWPEAVVAVPAAGVVIATGAISLGHAREEAERLGPVIGFLAAVLVLAQLYDDEGLFHACGAWMALSAAGRPRRLLVQVFAPASVITAVLSLDATIVLLTPVVFATAARLRARARSRCCHYTRRGHPFAGQGERIRPAPSPLPLQSPSSSR
ncbi:Na+/H+ antiporter NhaD/arsenite permease-like protein [Streptomyces sp. V3I7]|nr:Na+/H+ antiporter NhaD/arsenite permease-like protein [Streptomyces sp. V3I7]